MIKRPSADECAKIWESAIEAARKINDKPIALAIYDQAFMPVYLILEDGLGTRTLYAAMTKAFTCARIGKSTREVHRLIEERHYTLDSWCVEGTTDRLGGLPILDEENDQIGGIGVSGLLPAEDEEIAIAALNTFRSLRGIAE